MKKYQIIIHAIQKFTKFGSKSFTLDELASGLGISKKTIYKYFNTKEELVRESVQYLLEKFLTEISDLNTSSDDSIETIILIYKKGFEYLKHFKPSFLFGLKKYYPNAFKEFYSFRNYLVTKLIFDLLNASKNNGDIRKDVNIKLVCDILFLRIDDVLFSETSLFNKYSESEILNHLIINSLRGITSKNYTNKFYIE